MDDSLDKILNDNRFKNNRENYDLLCNDIKNNNISLTPFIGAGMTSFYYKMWKSLLLSLFEKIPKNDLTEDEIELFNTYIEKFEYDSAASHIKKKLNKDLYEYIRSEYSDEIITEDGLKNESIWFVPEAISSNLIITTNYDLVLENLYRYKNLKYEIANDQQSRFLLFAQLVQGELDNKTVLMKMHGDIRTTNEDELIFTEEDYNLFYSKDSKFWQQFSVLFQTRRLLFLGCSLSNDRTVQFLKSIQNIGCYTHYIIESAAGSKKERVKRKRYLESLRLKPIFYPSGEHQYVKLILESLSKRISGRLTKILNRQLNKCINEHSRRALPYEPPESNSYDDVFSYYVPLKLTTDNEKMEMLIPEKIHFRNFDKGNDKRTSKTFIRDRLSRTEESCTLEKAISKNRLLLLLGDYGSGKSTILNYLAATYSKLLIDSMNTSNFSSSKVQFFPLLIKCCDLSYTLINCSLEDVLNTHVSGLLDSPINISLILDEVKDAFNNIRFLLIFDGLDEIQSVKYKNRLLDRAAEFVRENLNVHIVLSMPERFLEDLDYPDRMFKTFWLQGIDFANKKYLLSRVVEQSTSIPPEIDCEHICDKLLEYLGNYRQIDELTGNPAMFSLLIKNVLYFPWYRDQDWLPQTKTIFIENALHSILKKGLDKTGDSPFIIDSLMLFMKYLAFVMTIESRKYFSLQELGDLFQEYQSNIPSASLMEDSSLEKLLKSNYYGTSILSPLAENNNSRFNQKWHFVYDDFRYYLAAKALSNGVTPLQFRKDNYLFFRMLIESITYKTGVKKKMIGWGTVYLNFNLTYLKTFKYYYEILDVNDRIELLQMIFDNINSLENPFTCKFLNCFVLELISEADSGDDTRSVVYISNALDSLSVLNQDKGEICIGSESFCLYDINVYIKQLRLSLYRYSTDCLDKFVRSRIYPAVMKNFCLRLEKESERGIFELYDQIHAIYWNKRFSDDGTKTHLLSPNDYLVELLSLLKEGTVEALSKVSSFASVYPFANYDFSPKLLREIICDAKHFFAQEDYYMQLYSVLIMSKYSYVLSRLEDSKLDLDFDEMIKMFQLDSSSIFLIDYKLYDNNADKEQLLSRLMSFNNKQLSVVFLNHICTYEFIKREYVQKVIVQLLSHPEYFGAMLSIICSCKATFLMNEIELFIESADVDKNRKILAKVCFTSELLGVSQIPRMIRLFENRECYLDDEKSRTRFFYCMADCIQMIGRELGEKLLFYLLSSLGEKASELLYFCSFNTISNIGCQTLFNQFETKTIFEKRSLIVAYFDSRSHECETEWILNFINKYKDLFDFDDWANILRLSATPQKEEFLSSLYVADAPFNLPHLKDLYGYVSLNYSAVLFAYNERKRTQSINLDSDIVVCLTNTIIVSKIDPGKEVIEDFLSMWKDRKDETNCRQIVGIISASKNKEYIDYIMQIMSETTDEGVLLTLINAAIDIGNPSIVPFLKQYQKDASCLVSLAASAAISLLTSKKTIEDIEKYLSNSDDYVRKNAVYFLFRARQGIDEIAYLSPDRHQWNYTLDKDVFYSDFLDPFIPISEYQILNVAYRLGISVSEVLDRYSTLREVYLISIDEGMDLLAMQKQLDDIHYEVDSWKCSFLQNDELG